MDPSIENPQELELWNSTTFWKLTSFLEQRPMQEPSHSQYIFVK